jgi:hypothetical protein
VETSNAKHKSSEARLLAGLDRLLSGKPVYSDGRLTKTNVARKPGSLLPLSTDANGYTRLGMTTSKMPFRSTRPLLPWKLSYPNFARRTEHCRRNDGSWSGNWKPPRQ